MIGAIERFAGYFILSFGWKRSLLALAAGGVSALAMPPVDAFPVLFITFPVLVWLMDATAADPGRGVFARFGAAFSTGWWFGLGFFLAGLWWIGHAFLVEADEFAFLLPVAVLGLPAFLALFFGAATALARVFWKDGFQRIAALALGLGLAEYLRGTVLTGFPWNTIGMAAMTTPLLMQKASLVGLYGVTALSILVFAAPALIAPRIAQRSSRFIFVALALAIADLLFGATRLATLKTAMVEEVSVRIVQPAIDQSEKWSPQMESTHFQTLMDLSVTATSAEKPGLSGTTLMVWPETAIPFLLTQRRDALASLGAMLPDGTVLVAGAVRVEPPAPGQKAERAFNSAYTVDGEGEITGAADKMHLVPFGEYLPMQEILESIGLQQLTKLRGGFEAGAARTLLDGGKAGKFLPLICYEIIFPGALGIGSERPAFIVNLTNDAWFGMTPGPYQHWRQAVLRGVEEGLPVIRAANSGISSVSDPAGRIIEKIPLSVRGVVDSPMPAPAMPTLYAQYGNKPFFAILLLLALVCALPNRAVNRGRH